MSCKGNQASTLILMFVANNHTTNQHCHQQCDQLPPPTNHTINVHTNTTTILCKWGNWFFQQNTSTRINFPSIHSVQESTMYHYNIRRINSSFSGNGLRKLPFLSSHELHQWRSNNTPTSTPISFKCTTSTSENKWKKVGHFHNYMYDNMSF